MPLVAGTAAVLGSVTLDGMQLKDWNLQAEADFKAGVAGKTGTTEGNVDVTKVSQLTTRRRLLATTLKVDFEILTTLQMAAATAEQLKSEVESGSLAIALKSAGSGDSFGALTGVALQGPPATVLGYYSPPPPPPSPPPVKVGDDIFDGVNLIIFAACAAGFMVCTGVVGVVCFCHRKKKNADRVSGPPTPSPASSPLPKKKDKGKKKMGAEGGGDDPTLYSNPSFRSPDDMGIAEDDSDSDVEAGEGRRGHGAYGEGPEYPTPPPADRLDRKPLPAIGQTRPKSAKGSRSKGPERGELDAPQARKELPPVRAPGKGPMPDPWLSTQGS